MYVLSLKLRCALPTPAREAHAAENISTLDDQKSVSPKGVPARLRLVSKFTKSSSKYLLPSTDGTFLNITTFGHAFLSSNYTVHSTVNIVKSSLYILRIKAQNSLEEETCT